MEMLYTVSDKGLALIAARESGLLDAMDDDEAETSFDVFWGCYENLMSQKGRKGLDDAIEMLQQEREERTKSRADYRRGYLHGVIPSVVGYLCGAILTALLHLL